MSGSLDAQMQDVDGSAIQDLRAQLQQLTQAMSTMQQKLTARADPSVMEDEEDPEISWGEIILSTRVEPTQEDTVKFIKLLSSSPNLKDLREASQQVKLFSGVPETPPPRQNKIDHNWYTVQHKMEMCMHLMAQFMDGNNRISLRAAAAWLRSAWQDAQEDRLQFMAGPQAWKLPPRPDDKKPRLFSAEEEKTLARPQAQGRSSMKPSYQWGQDSDNRQPRPRQRWVPADRSRSTSRPQGKGKGKGKGKGHRPWQK